MLWLDALLAYTHFVAIIGTVSTVVVEAVLCRPGLTLPWAQRLGRVDLFYLVMAALALTTGFLRVFFGIKGSTFYFSNPVFWIKIGIFIAVGLISILPTLRFLRWTKTLQANEGGVIEAAEVIGTARIVYIELVLLALIPLMATLMARGFGW